MCPGLGRLGELSKCVGVRAWDQSVESRLKISGCPSGEERRGDVAWRCLYLDGVNHDVVCEDGEGPREAAFVLVLDLQVPRTSVILCEEEIDRA